MNTATHPSRLRSAMRSKSSRCQMLMFSMLAAAISCAAQVPVEVLPVYHVESGNTNHLVNYPDSRAGFNPSVINTLSVDSAPAHGRVLINTAQWQFPPYRDKVLSYASDPGYAGEDGFMYTLVQATTSFSLGNNTSTTVYTTNRYAVRLIVLPSAPAPIGPLTVLMNQSTNLFSFIDMSRQGVNPPASTSLMLESVATHGSVDIALHFGPLFDYRVNYTPNPHYTGNDQFSFTVVQSSFVYAAGNAVGLERITNRHVVNLQVPPDCSLPPTLECADMIVTCAAGRTSAVVPAFDIRATHNCGTVTAICTPPAGSTFPVGITAVNCTAALGTGSGASCVFQVTVLCPPTAKLLAAPLFWYPPFLSHPAMISCNGSNSALTLDGSLSSDPRTPNSGLSFAWFDEPSVLPLAAGEIVSNAVFAIGPHTIKLVVTEPGGLTGTDELTVDNITLCDATDVIMADINASPIPRKETRPLLAALKTACTSFSRGKCSAGRQQLSAFIRKADQQLGASSRAGPKGNPAYPAEAARFKAGAQAILDAIARAELLGMCACH